LRSQSSILTPSDAESDLAGRLDNRYPPHALGSAVTQRPLASPIRLAAKERWSLVLAALGLAAVLATAGWLSPDPRGFGTHQQLGLPPCTFKALFGVRCPACGMTTSWSNLIHGRIGLALRAHVVGTLLGASAVATVVWLLACAACGRWLGWTPDADAAGRLVLIPAAMVLIEWGVRWYAGML
jgi:hypothetical protein